MPKMKITYRDWDNDITYDPVVEGPRVVLYDSRGKPLYRPVGFAPPPK